MGEVVMEDVVMVLGVVVLRGRLGREGRGGGVEVVVRGESCEEVGFSSSCWRKDTSAAGLFLPPTVVVDEVMEVVGVMVVVEVAVVVVATLAVALQVCLTRHLVCMRPSHLPLGQGTGLVAPFMTVEHTRQEGYSFPTFLEEEEEREEDEEEGRRLRRAAWNASISC